MLLITERFEGNAFAAALERVFVARAMREIRAFLVALFTPLSHEGIITLAAHTPSLVGGARDRIRIPVAVLCVGAEGTIRSFFVVTKVARVAANARVAVGAHANALTRFHPSDTVVKTVRSVACRAR